MKTFSILIILLLGFSSFTSASNISSKYIKPLEIRIMSDDNGVIQEEKMCCTRQTCCFAENYYCDIEDGKCICDLSMLQQGPDQKEYWLEITGFLSRMYCDKPQLLHKLTTLCLCDQVRPPDLKINTPFKYCQGYLPRR